MNPTNEEVKNYVIIKIADEIYHFAAQKQVQRDLTSEELVNVKEDIEKELKDWVMRIIKERVEKTISQSLTKKSKEVGASMPRYEVHVKCYASAYETYMKCEQAFATEQDAREYVALNPYREMKIIKVENSVVYESPSNETESDLPF